MSCRRSEGEGHTKKTRRFDRIWGESGGTAKAETGEIILLGNARQVTANQGCCTLLLVGNAARLPTALLDVLQS